MSTGFTDHMSSMEAKAPRIDAQHKRLFELAATFADSGDHIRMMKTLTILCDHVKTHFREEEDMMAACGFPGLEEHRRLHGECRKMLVDLLAEAQRMSLDQLADAVSRLINGWIHNHILTADAEYAPYCQSMNVRCKPGNPTAGRLSREAEGVAVSAEVSVG